MARALAKELGYIYVDPGALYRAIGLYMRRKHPGDFAAVAKSGRRGVRLAFRDGSSAFPCGRRCFRRHPYQDIRLASISAVGGARFPVDLQRDLAKKPCGYGRRDIGLSPECTG
ncbi:MAG: hypothetical protein ACLRXC_13305 [[Clostridium] leptum]